MCLMPPAGLAALRVQVPCCSADLPDSAHGVVELKDPPQPEVVHIARCG